MAAREGQHRYDRFFALSSDLLSIVSFDGRFVQVNDAWERTLGWTREDLVGRPFLDFVHPEDRPITDTELEHVTELRPDPLFENRYRHRDGSWRWLAWTSTPSEEDQLIYAIARDVTQERRARSWAEEVQQVAGVGGWELDLGSGLLELSPQARRIHGLDPSSSAPVPVEVVRADFHPEDVPVLDAAQRALVSTGTPFDRVFELRPLEDRRRWIRVTGRARVRDGAVVRVFGSVQDVTDRQVQQRELEEANAHLVRANTRLERAQALVRIGDWRGDLRTGEVVWSAEMYRMFGLDPATTTPTLEAFRAMVHPDDTALLAEREAESTRTGRLDVIHRIVRPDGEVRTVHALAAAEVDDAGSLTALAGTLQDITEARQAELALLESEQQLERALAASRDGWWEVQVDDGSIRCSERWWQLYGFEPGEVPLTMDLVRSLVVEEEREAVLRRLRGALAGEEDQLSLRTVALRRDGSSFPVELRVRIERDEAGQPLRITGTTRDLTEVVRAEQLQEEFLATVSHELRTPLTSISGALELLQAGRGGPIHDGQVDLVAVASRNTRRLRRLIDDLLDTERLSSGRQGIVLRPTRLVPLLERAVADHLSRREEDEVPVVLEVQLSCDRTLPLDPDRIGQVVLNLLSNAGRYAPEGTVVTLRASEEESGVRVAVIDHGPGVPPEFAERAFTRFAQADPDDPRSRGGTGLGLAISREIVERHGGTIGYTSVPGHTEFHVTIPDPDEA